MLCSRKEKLEEIILDLTGRLELNDKEAQQLYDAVEELEELEDVQN